MEKRSKQARIETAHSPSQAEFEVLSSGYSRPLLLTGIVEHWEACRLWTPEYLSSILADLPVRVFYSPQGFFSGDPNLGFLGKFRYMPFQKFYEMLASSNSKQYYLSQQPLDAKGFSGLKSDLGVPPYFNMDKNVVCNIWVGGAGIVSPLHHDAMHNMFVQVRGEKLFVLYSPNDSKYLYAFPENSKLPHMSQVNIDAVDYSKYPLFRHAESLHVKVEPGNVLFLPRGWWHQVYTATASISVNYWSNAFAAPS
jgi:hypothetical protein